MYTVAMKRYIERESADWVCAFEKKKEEQEEEEKRDEEDSETTDNSRVKKRASI